jgi:hypothetical protein
MPVEVRRLLDGPIIHRGLHPSFGDNVNGPSLIRVPEWVPSPLGRYYLYFAHHEGRHIRLAHADALTGPWRVHAPGALHLSETPLPQTAPPVPEPASAMARGDDRFFAHIASPDVHVGENRLTM